MPTPIGRLAPSPTGLLHLGNAWAFLLAWLDAKAGGGIIILRMEDLDPARSRPEFAEIIRADLRWLGLVWDQETEPQSRRGNFYAEILEQLGRQGLTYPCFCTRKELRELLELQDLAGAPHVEDYGAPYPGTCRKLSAAERQRLLDTGRKPCLRLRCPEERSWSFRDLLQGEQAFSLREVGGDFALRRSDGVFAYQLAVVCDDLAMGVNRVVRGRDILPSTPRQLYLYSLLGGSPPTYAHLPLLLDASGERLAKRHDSLSLKALREAGVRPETLLGFLAHLSGLRKEFSPLRAEDLLPDFSLSRLNPEDLRLPDKLPEFLSRRQKGL